MLLANDVYGESRVWGMPTPHTLYSEITVETASPSTVDDQIVAVHVRCGVRGEEENGLSDLVRLPRPPLRDK